MSSFNKLTELDIANGANPYLGSSFIEVPEGGPLPVTLINFAGKNNGAINKLVWKVADEENVNYYELQRRGNGQHSQLSVKRKLLATTAIFITITFYSKPNIYYYRLKIVDKDANFKYSEIIQLRNDLNKNFATVNPNPFKDGLVVTIESILPDKVTFILTDASGRQIVRENKTRFRGTNVMRINETGKLTKGIYLLTAIKSIQSQTIKVVKGN